jgi:hypothetical protein
MRTTTKTTQDKRWIRVSKWVESKYACHGSRAVYGLHCLCSLGSRDHGFESHSGHGCLVFVCMCAFFCVYVQVEALR